jgi:hypothetical protein
MAPRNFLFLVRSVQMYQLPVDAKAFWIYCRQLAFFMLISQPRIMAIVENSLVNLIKKLCSQIICILSNNSVQYLLCNLPNSIMRCGF